MIRVVHVITSPEGGGAERIVRELNSQLPQHGMDSRAIYFSNPTGAVLSSRETSLELRSPRSPLAVPRLRQALRQLVNDAAGDQLIVHAHLTWPLYYVPLACAGLGVPCVYTEHSTYNKRRDRPWMRPVERWIYRHYEHVVCISEGSKISLAEWLGEEALTARMISIVNGSRMLPVGQRPRQFGQPGRLVSVGSLKSHKGFDLALRAIAQLGDKVANYTIVGEGPERARLEELVRELGLTDKVNIPGYSETVTSYFHEADMCVVPSRWEGFGLVAVEALSTGLPLVASDVAGLREVVSPCDATLLSKPGDVDALRAAIEFGLDNLVGRKDVSKSARLRAEMFTVDSMVGRYADLYEGLVERREASS